MHVCKLYSVVFRLTVITLKHQFILIKSLLLNGSMITEQMVTREQHEKLAFHPSLRGEPKTKGPFSLPLTFTGEMAIKDYTIVGLTLSLIRSLTKSIAPCLSKVTVFHS